MVEVGSRQAAEASLARLYHDTKRVVYGFLVARCGSAVLAEDLTAATYEHAAREFVRGRGEVVDTSWLLTVARRRLIDHWRRVERDRGREQRLRDAAYVDAPAGADGMDALTDEEVLGALQSLPDRQRAALVLRYLDDFSVAEVAEALVCTYRTAESLLARARRSFRTAMEGVGDGR